MSARARREAAIALGLAAAAWVVFYPGLVFFHQVVFAGDTFTMDLPARLYLARRLRAGELPLWYPFDGLGVPLIGSLVFGVFHPFTLLYLWLDVGTALAVSQVLLAGLAVTGAYLLARRLGIGVAGACIVGLGFGVGGPFVSALDHVQFATGISGFPWFLIGVHLIHRGRVRRGLVLSSVLFALAILGGDVQAAYLYGLLGVAFSFFLPHPTPLGRRALHFAAVAGLGLALAAVQFLPTLAIAPVVYRAHGVAWPSASKWSTHPFRLPDLFLGDTLRVTPGAHIQLEPLYGLPGGPWFPTVYLGALVALGVVVALVVRAGERRLRLGLLAAAVLVLLAAMGRYGGLYRLLYLALPGWSAFRYPMKLMPYAGLFWLLLGGLGLDAALAAPRRALRPAAGVVAVGAVLFLVIRLAHDPLASLVAGVTGTRMEATVLPLASALYVAHLWLALGHALVLWLIGLGALFLARGTGSRRATLAAALLVAAQLVDLTGVNGRTLYVTAGDRSVLQQPSPFAAAIHRRFGTTYGRLRLTNAVGGTESQRTPDVVAHQGATYQGVATWQRKALVPDLGGVYGIETDFPYLPSNLGRFWRHLHGHMTRFLLTEAPLFNAGLVTATPTLYAGSGLPEDLVLARLPRANLLLARLPAEAVRPRAFLARPLFVDGEAGAEGALMDPAVRLGKEAAVEGPDDVPHGPGGGTVRITHYAPEAVAISVDAPPGGDSVLVLNDAWFPGWRARLDGRPVAIHHANLLVRGILVPPGHHLVRFRYPVPVSLKAGAGISCASLLLLAFLGLRRRPHPGDAGGRSPSEG